MRKTGKVFYALLLIFLLSGNATYFESHQYTKKALTTRTKVNKISAQPKYTKKTLRPFNKIIASGNFNLIIIQNPTTPSITTLNKPTKFIPEIKVEKNCLYIYSKDNDCQTMTISLNNLNSLYTSGNVTVTANNLRSNCLCINTCSHCNTYLRGCMNINRIVDNGPGQLIIIGARSQHVHIRSADSAKIAITGSTEILDIRAYDHACVNARRLIATHIVAQTTDHAFSEVTPIMSLRAFASKSGNIYYYEEPSLIITHTIESGAVLPMYYNSFSAPNFIRQNVQL